ncbi:hypothetical protein FA95DRAFT_1679899 [Auriscalpium vulgare]|uniref:Uncharacterized protein n=1 Tax=Auriscalpium vulgare TaxID=40419 RepID=A0ACB8RQ14_9AGAM|nr:hypothetical protein FA95DRAFT_1679899 [Auriscalpium vulgare]
MNDSSNLSCGLLLALDYQPLSALDDILLTSDHPNPSSGDITFGSLLSLPDEQDKWYLLDGLGLGEDSCNSLSDSCQTAEDTQRRVLKLMPLPDINAPQNCDDDE